MIKNFFYFTATVLNWKHILKTGKYKDVRAVVGVPKSLQIQSLKFKTLVMQTFWSPTTKPVT